MATERNAFKAGLFIVASIVLIIAVIVGIKGLGQILEPFQVRKAVFNLSDDIGGLRIGDDVRVGGLKVGIVRSLEIESGNEKTQPRVFVGFRIPQRLVLREGAHLMIQNTVTGSSWLNFDSIGAGKVIPEDQVLQGKPGTMTQILAEVTELAPELRQIAHDIRAVTIPKLNGTLENTAALSGDLRGRVDKVVQRYETVTARLTEALVNLRDILGDSKVDIRGVFANANSATGTLKEKLPKVMDDFDQSLVKINKSLDTVQVALKDLNVTMDHAQELAGSARSVLARNRTRIDELVQSAKEAADNLKYATAEIRRSPWRLLYKPHSGEMANLNLFDAARDFAEGANDMSDAATALRDALKDPKADPEMIQKLVNQLDHSFGKFQTVEDTLWKRVKE